MLSLWSLCNGDKKDILSDISHNRVCQIHMTFLCASFIKILLVMLLGKTGKGFLAWNRQLFSNIIYVIQKHIEAINHITDTTDSWDVICNVKCYALFTDFSKIKQLQPTLTHVAKPKGTFAVCKHCISCLEVSKNCNSEVFWELCMCCQHDEHSHNIYVTTTTKDRSTKCFRDSKFVQIMNIQPKGEIAYTTWRAFDVATKKIIEHPKHHENLKYEYLAKVWVCSGLRW